MTTAETKCQLCGSTQYDELHSGFRCGGFCWVGFPICGTCWSGLGLNKSSMYDLIVQLLKEKAGIKP